MHTDSSQRRVHPQIVGLACIRPAPVGGGSRLSSASFAHEKLKAEAPELLTALYHPYIRDLVTPGSADERMALIDNSFPIFQYDQRLFFRYMRYWIERGHHKVGLRLSPLSIDAFDALDEILNSPENQLQFTMKSGDFLFIDNTLIAHDRDAYQDDPAHKRLMVRLWLDDLGRENKGD